jgi:hypothetical protein
MDPLRRNPPRIYSWNGQAWNATPHLEGTVDTIQVTVGGTVWAHTTVPNSLARWRPGETQWSQFKDGQLGLKGDQHVWSPFAIVGEEVWGISPRGAVHYDGHRWARHTQGVVSDSPRTIAANRNNVWILDRQGNLSHYDGNRWSLSKVQLPGKAFVEER